MITAFARARGVWPAVISLIVLVLADRFVIRRSLALGLPQPIPAAWLVRIAMVLGVQQLLLPAYGALESTWVRARVERLVRGALAIAVVAIGSTVLTIWHDESPVLCVFALVVLGVSCAVSSWRPHLGWGAVLGLGALCVYVEVADMTQPVSQALARIGLWGGALVLAVGAAVFVGRR